MSSTFSYLELSAVIMLKSASLPPCQPQQPQGGNQFSGGAQSRPQQSAPAAPSNEPPMDFDDDIPF